MGKTLAYKILENHIVEGKLSPGEEITIRIDQTLTQDSTGTMVYLQLEAMEIDKVKTELSVCLLYTSSRHGHALQVLLPLRIP